MLLACLTTGSQLLSQQANFCTWCLNVWSWNFLHCLPISLCEMKCVTVWKCYVYRINHVEILSYVSQLCVNNSRSWSCIRDHSDGMLGTTWTERVAECWSRLPEAGIMAPSCQSSTSIWQCCQAQGLVFKVVICAARSWTQRSLWVPSNSQCCDAMIKQVKKQMSFLGIIVF